MHDEARTGLRRAVTLTLATALLAGCALLDDLHAGGRGASAEPSTAASSEPATASEPQAVPDPLHPTEHRVGEPVDIGNATIVFLGLVNGDLGTVATFRLDGGSWPAGVRLVVNGGRIVDLVRAGTLIESEPFADVPTQVTLVVGDSLFVFTT